MADRTRLRDRSRLRDIDMGTHTKSAGGFGITAMVAVRFTETPPQPQLPWGE
jgi:hypothetical protein